MLSVFDPDLVHLQGIRTSIGQGVPRDSWPTLLNVSWACGVFEHDSLDTVVMTGFVPCEIMFDARPESAWSSPRPMPRLVFVFEGAELVPDSNFADRLLVDLVENSYCYKVGTQSRVQDLDDLDPPFDVRFRSIDFWADDEAVERIKTAAQGTVLEDGGTDTWINSPPAPEFLRPRLEILSAGCSDSVSLRRRPVQQPWRTSRPRPDKERPTTDPPSRPSAPEMITQEEVSLSLRLPTSDVADA